MPEASSEEISKVREIALAHPGLGYEALARQLGVRLSAGRAVIRAAVASGVLHEGPSRVPTRGGATRSCIGLFPEPQNTPLAVAVGTDGAQLRQMREAAELSAAQIAAQMGYETGQGVSDSLIYHWETNRQPIPEWALTAYGEALQRAHTLKHRPADADRRRRRTRMASAILTELRENPGQGRQQLADALEVDRGTVTKYLEPLIDRGRAHWAPSEYAPKHGPAAHMGLFAGPAPLPRPMPTPSDFDAATKRTGNVDGQQVGKRLGMHRETWYTILRDSRPMPGYVTPERAGEVMAWLVAIGRERRESVLEFLRAAGGRDTLHALHRHFGSTASPQWLELALEDLGQAGRLHRGSYPQTDASGATHVRDMYALGPAPAPIEPLSGAQLRTMLEERGLSTSAAARSLGVAVGAVQQWLVRPVIPSGNVARIRTTIEPLPLAPEPVRIRRSVPESELRASVLEFLAEKPGSTRKALHKAVGTTQPRVSALIATMLEEGALQAVEVSRRGHGLVPLLYLAGGAPEG